MRTQRPSDGNRLDGKAGWTVVAAVTVILTFTSGARLLPGVVLKPVTKDYGWSRSDLMFALTINMVVLSALQPVLGLVTDRIGAKRVLVAGTALLGLLMFPLSRATELWHFYVIYGVVGAVAFAAVSPVNVTSLVSGWFDRRKGSALAVATSGSAFGQLMIVPIATWLLTTTTWRTLYLMLGVVIAVGMVPIGLAFVRANGQAGPRVGGHGSPPSQPSAVSATLKEAVAESPFWLLAFGFFVCGFTMAFANAHFIAYADDMGMSMTRAADMVALTAVFSIVASFSLGLVADRRDRRYVLAVVYGLRGFAFLLLWLMPAGNLLFVYSIVLGISWTATTPLTAAIAADMYGRTNIGVIFGLMFSFMNIGLGAGSFLDGLVYDSFGNYRGALVANMVLGGLAAIAVSRVQFADAGSGRTVAVPATPVSDDARTAPVLP